MSVLIKNMEMPKNCMCCPFPTVGTDAFYCQCPTMDGKEYDFEQAERRPFDCPLVELPEPHAEDVDNAPTIKPERNKGLWHWADGMYSCDQCGEMLDEKSPFCPMCGAVMRGEQNEND